MCFITLFFFSSFPPFFFPFFNSSFKFFPVFHFGQKFPTLPREGGGDGQNIYPCLKKHLFPFLVESWTDQRLNIDFYDEDKRRRDDFIGSIQQEVELISPGK